MPSTSQPIQRFRTIFRKRKSAGPSDDVYVSMVVVPGPSTTKDSKSDSY